MGLKPWYTSKKLWTGVRLELFGLALAWLLWHHPERRADIVYIAAAAGPFLLGGATSFIFAEAGIDRARLKTPLGEAETLQVNVEGSASNRHEKTFATLEEMEEGEAG